MGVALDVASESHTGSTTASNLQASFSWLHTPVGTPRGVTVFVISVSSLGDITSVTYGGVALSQVAFAADTNTEQAETWAFHLGSSIPTGPQTIVVNTNSLGSNVYAVAFTVTAAKDTEIYVPGIVLLQEDGTLAEQNVDDGSTGVNSLRLAGGFTGINTAVSAGSHSTAGPDFDFGIDVAQTVSETTPGQGSRPVGFSSGTSDDRAFIHLAVREVVSTSSPHQLIDSGLINRGLINAGLVA